MAIGVVASTGKAGTQNGVTSNAIDTTGANLIVLAVSYYGGLGNTLIAGEVSDSKGNTWTALTNRGSNNAGNVRLFYCSNPTVGSGHTFTASDSGGGGTYPSLFAIALSGAKTSSPFDLENGSNTTSPGLLHS